MNELMGLIFGKYDAKEEGFSAGGISIHNCMTAHGSDARTFKIASEQNYNLNIIKNTLAFMFESRFPWRITKDAYHHIHRQQDYANVGKD